MQRDPKMLCTWTQQGNSLQRDRLELLGWDGWNRNVPLLIGEQDIGLFCLSCFPVQQLLLPSLHKLRDCVLGGPPCPFAGCHRLCVLVHFFLILRAAFHSFCFFLPIKQPNFLVRRSWKEAEQSLSLFEFFCSPEGVGWASQRCLSCCLASLPEDLQHQTSCEQTSGCLLCRGWCSVKCQWRCELWIHYSASRKQRCDVAFLLILLGCVLHFHLFSYKISKPGANVCWKTS